jgi:hypothetical protein
VKKGNGNAVLYSTWDCLWALSVRKLVSVFFFLLLKPVVLAHTRKENVAGFSSGEHIHPHANNCFV